jgi:hypothetical protein
MSIGNSIKRVGLTRTVEWTLDYLMKSPEKNLKNAVNFLNSVANTFNLTPTFKDQIAGVKNLVDQNKPGAQLVINILKDTNPTVLKKLGVNFIVNAAWAGVPMQNKLTVEEGTKIPWF